MSSAQISLPSQCAWILPAAASLTNFPFALALSLTSSMARCICEHLTTLKCGYGASAFAAHVDELLDKAKRLKLGRFLVTYWQKRPRVCFSTWHCRNPAPPLVNLMRSLNKLTMPHNIRNRGGAGRWHLLATVVQKPGLLSSN